MPINSATGRVNKTNVKKKKKQEQRNGRKKKNNGGDKVTTSILYLFLETIRKVENVNEENQKKKNEENCYKTSKIVPLALSNLEKT